jgi:transcriptional regulator with XRE-family HTH domain
MLADYLSLLPASQNEKRFVDKSMQLSGLIWEAMQRKKLTQCGLADLLGKKESEVSRWLSGLHNFTLKTLTRIEAVLEEDLVLVFRDAQEQDQKAASAIQRTIRPEAQLNDRWTTAPFQAVTVNPAKSTMANQAADLVTFSLRAA